jgi:trehalose synthase
VRCHLQRLAIGRRTAADYGDAAAERLRAAAGPVEGVGVAHVIAAGSRLRSTDLLPSLLSLYEDLGLHTELYGLAGDRPLWRLVRELEDGLQGGETAITDEGWSDYLESTPTIEGADVVVIHGPGPLGVKAPKRIWRPGLDRSNADAATWQRLQPLAADCPTASGEAIDPLAPACVELPVRLAGSMLRSAGVDLSRPCCCQIRPFDTWQDPHDVLDAFELASQELPTLQLVLAGDPERGDIEAWRLLREVSDYAHSQDGLLLLTGPEGLGAVELNALRTISRATIESSIAPAAGTTALETMWKSKPLIAAGNVGPAHPVEDNVNGYTTTTPEQTAERLVELVKDPGLGIELGAAGRKLVEQSHLITTLAENELRLLATVQSA